MSTSRAPVGARLPLIPLLAAVALLELGLNRLFLRLLRFEPALVHTRLLKIVDALSRFTFELLSVLAVLLLAAALLRISLVGKHHRAGARVSFPLVGGVTLALAALGVVVRLPPPLLFHFHLSFLFLALLVVLTTWASPTGIGVKLGATSLFVAYAIRLVPSMGRRYWPMSAALDADTIAVLRIALSVAIIHASLALLPRRGGSKLATVTTWLVVCGAAVMMRRDFDTGQRIASYGLQVDLPYPIWGQAVFLLALGLYVNTMVRSLTAPGPTRLRGWGLLLLLLGGLQLELSYQVVLATLGLLCLAESAVRPDLRAMPAELFDRLARLGAAAIGSKSLSVVGDAGNEVVRASSPAEAGVPTSLLLRRRGGVVDELEISVGEVPPRDPPFSLERRGARGLGPRADGPPVETGDLEFDRAFVLRDGRSVGARLLDDATRAGLLQLCGGWLGIWPQRGLRYRASELGDSEEMLPKLISFLKEINAKTN